MAIVKFTPPLDGIRGTSGTTTYTAGLAGPYIRRWRMGPRRRTPGQTPIRNQLSSLAASWRTLSQDSRDAWNAYAADPAQEKTNSLGQPYYLNGLMWYIAINQNLTSAAFPSMSDPPDNPTPTAPTITAAFVYNPVVPPLLSRITFPKNEIQNLLNVAFVLLTPGLGNIVASNNFLLLTAKITDADTYAYIDAELADVLGTFNVGQRVFLDCAAQSTEGARSPYTSLYTDVVAG